MISDFVRSEYRKRHAANVNWRAQYPNREISAGDHVSTTALAALRTARTLEAWEALESKGKVRLRCGPDDFDIVAEHEIYRRPKRDAHPEAVRAWEDRIRKLKSDGVWWYVAEYLDESTGCWEQADSIGGVQGELDDDFYGEDLRASAIEKYHEAREAYLAEQRHQIEARATYAAGGAL